VRNDGLRFSPTRVTTSHVLILVGEDGNTPTFKVYDPKENDRLVESFDDYIAARNWLNEDDFYLVNGREDFLE
jgi:hypothetical protein